MTVAKMVKAEIAYSFQDIHTGVIYEPGTVQEFTETRLAEIHQNLPGFVKELEQDQVDEAEKPKKKSSRKATVADDEPAVE